MLVICHVCLLQVKAGADILQLTRLSKILNACTSNKHEVDSSMPDEKVSILCLQCISILHLSHQNSCENQATIRYVTIKWKAYFQFRGSTVGIWIPV